MNSSSAGAEKSMFWFVVSPGVCASEGFKVRSGGWSCARQSWTLGRGRVRRGGPRRPEVEGDREESSWALKRTFRR